MAGRGPAPKEQHSRSRDDHTVERVELTDEVFGDPLPDDVLPEGESWHPQTLIWWEALRRWPLLKAQPDLAWSYLIATAMLHHRMWTDGNTKLAAELRIREAKFGVTPEDQMRLKIKVMHPDAQRPASPTTGPVTDIASRRGRLGA